MYIVQILTVVVAYGKLDTCVALAAFDSLVDAQSAVAVLAASTMTIQGGNSSFVKQQGLLLNPPSPTPAAAKGKKQKQ